MEVPAELEGGVYANFLVVWHSGHEFTFDFAVTQPPRPLDPGDAGSPVTVPCRTVARVKIPPTLVRNVLEALEQNVTRFESTFGRIIERVVREPQEEIHEP